MPSLLLPTTAAKAPVAQVAQPAAQVLQPQKAAVPTNRYVEYRTAEGNLYYYNLVTGQTVWTLPPAAVLEQLPQQRLLAQQQDQQQQRRQVQWRRVFDDSSGKPYYHNLITDEVWWELPEGAILAFT